MPDLIEAGVPRDAAIPLLTDVQIDAMVEAAVAEAVMVSADANRTARRRPRWAIPIAAAAVGLTVLGMTLFTPGATPAWSAVPHDLSAADLTAAEHECQSMNSRSGASVVASEARGDSVFMILDDTSQCLWAFGASMGGTNRDPGQATGDQVRVATNNVAGGAVDGADVLPDGNPKPGSGQWISSISGRVGPDVQGIVVHRDGAGDVVATVQNGWFMAWWPGEQAGTSLTVSGAGGDRQQPLGG